MAEMLKFVDVGPNLGLQGFVVDRGFPATGAAGVEFSNQPRAGRRRFRQFDEDAAYFLDVVSLADDVLVTQQVTESQLSRLRFRLRPGVKWAVLRA